MFLFGVEVVFVSYAGVRLYEKFNKKNSTKSKIVSKTTKNEAILKKSKPLKVNNVIEKDESEESLHYIKTSALSLGFSGLTAINPIFLPAMLATFTYSTIPYLRIVENSIRKKKKVDGYVLYGIADMMTLGLGHLATASLAVGLVHSASFIIQRAQKDSKESLVNIFSKQVNNVWILKNGIELETPLEKISKGDIVIVRTGEIIPVDGTIVMGMATIDQHTLTGEFQPMEKNEGDKVFASTQVMSGLIRIKVQTSGDDTTVAKITNILNHSIDFKTNSQLKGEEWADRWNLPVLFLAFATMPILGPIGTVVILNGHIAQNIRIVAPLSTLNYLNIAAHKGILIKDGRVLEDLSKIDTFLFDKTGTLTSEEPEVGRILSFLPNYSENDILAYAAASEVKLKHPIARAILKHAKERGVIIPEIDDSNYTIGYGISVKIEGKLIQVGSYRFMKKEEIKIPGNFNKEMKYSYEEGHSLVMIAIDKEFAGALEIRASIRPEVKLLLENLRKNGVNHLAIVSGDQKQATKKLAEKLGMDDYFYEVLPQDKAKIVEELQSKGRKVCFIGDGVNDTIAMKKANISISMSGATSVATDTAQIILMDGSLIKVNELFKISFELDKNLQKGWLYNIVPGTATILYAFTPNVTIATALLISQSGLVAGVINAMLPLQKMKKNKKRSLKYEKTIHYGNKFSLS